MTIAFFLYRSETTMVPAGDAARGLLETARRVNESLGLTGFLHHEDGFFFQWLEGPAEALEMIGQRIGADQRHFGIDYLWRDTQDERQFANWKMGYSTHTDSSILTWLADHAVALREKRSYANAVLSFLKERNAPAG